MELRATKFYGITLHTENYRDWWLIDDNGNETHFDHEPTTAEIDAFRAAVCY